MRRQEIFLLLIVSFALMLSCKDRYEPLVIVKAPHYLVVEGFINTVGDTTTVSLSRTVQISDTARAIPETNASVLIETENNDLYYLTEQTPGIYEGSNVYLPPLKKCRLRIITLDGKEYVSDFAVSKVVPPIDSVNWAFDEKGVHIKVTTHDPTNATRYYHWEYDETWEFHAAYYSMYDYNNGQLIFRDHPDSLYTCWQSGHSTNIITASSEKLSDDIIREWPLISIEKDTWKLSVKYSIMVRQYPLSKEGFLYLENMKKNSEKLGTIFDPLPSELTGNIHCISDPNEKVIGFIDAGSYTEKRIFIDRKELPSWRYFQGCDEFETPGDSLEYYFGNGVNIPTIDGHAMGFYKGSVKYCVDCRVRGTNTKPAFWP